MAIHKTKDKFTFLEWIPELNSRIFKNFKVLSITIEVESLSILGGTAKFEYKKESD
jgi:hypothetical protein